MHLVEDRDTDRVSLTSFTVNSSYLDLSRSQTGKGHTRRIKTDPNALETLTRSAQKYKTKR